MRSTSAMWSDRLTRRRADGSTAGWLSECEPHAHGPQRALEGSQDQAQALQGDGAEQRRVPDLAEEDRTGRDDTFVFEETVPDVALDDGPVGQHEVEAARGSEPDG